MKVLIINTVRFRLNGITSVIMNYYRHIDKDGFRIDFAVVNEISDEYRTKLEENGSRIFNIGPKKYIYEYVTNLNKVIKKEEYSIVHIHGNSSTMALEAFVAKKNHVKKIIVHAHNTECEYPTVNLFLRPIMKLLATDFLACSNAVGKWLYKNDNFTVLNNAIDIDRFRFDSHSRDICRKEFDFREDEFIIGHIGNFIEQKNHEFLIDVFEEYHKFNSKSKLFLAGDGMLTGKIREKVIDKGLTDFVIFAGCRNDIERIYCAIDVFVLPSKWEGMPVVLIEALASGLPCLVSEKVSKNADLTGNLTYLPIDNALLWKDAINKIYNNESVRVQLSEMNIRKISLKGYDIKTEAEKLRKLYFE